METINIRNNIKPDPIHAAVTIAQLPIFRIFDVKIRDEKPNIKIATPRLAPALIPNT